MSRRRPGPNDDSISFEEAAVLAGIPDDLEEKFDTAPVVVKHAIPEIDANKLYGRRITLVIERVDNKHDDPMEPTVRVALLGYLLGLAEDTAGKAAEEHFRVNAATKMVVKGISFEVETTNEDQQIGSGSPVEVR